MKNKLLNLTIYQILCHSKSETETIEKGSHFLGSPIL